MHTSWRAIMAATVTAVAATVALAVVVAAAPAQGGVATPAVAHARGRTGAAPASAELPPVTEHAVDPQVLVAARSSTGTHGGGQTVTQTIQLTVVGGDLEVVTDHATVVLTRVPGSARDWTGTLLPVRVVDARGTHEGWTVRWAVTALGVHGASPPAHVPTTKVQLDPQAPAAVAGSADGLVAGKPGPAVRAGRPLFSAAAGTGGGTFEAGATVRLRVPASVEADRVEVELAFTVG